MHYGNPAATSRVVESLRRCGFSPAQVIVVENGSSSGISPEVAHAVFLSENRGYAAGANAGAGVAFRGGATHVLILNNDMTYAKGTAETMVETARGRVGCVGARIREGVRIRSGGGRVSWFRGRAVLLAPEATGMPHYVHGASFLVTRQCFEDVGGLPEEYFLYWEDVAFGFRLRARGWDLAVAATPLLYHEENGATSGGSRKTYYLVRNGALFVRRYAPPRVRQWLLALEPARAAWAARRGHFEVVRGLRDAAAGVTGPLPGCVDLGMPP